MHRCSMWWLFSSSGVLFYLLRSSICSKPSLREGRTSLYEILWDTIRWYETEDELRLCTWGRTNTRTRSCWSTDSPRRLGQKFQVFRQISSCCLVICKSLCAGHLVSCGQAFVSSRVCFSVPCKSYKCPSTFLAAEDASRSKIHFFNLELKVLAAASWKCRTGRGQRQGSHRDHREYLRYF